MVTINNCKFKLLLKFMFHSVLKIKPLLNSESIHNLLEVLTGFIGLHKWTYYFISIHYQTQTIEI